MFWAKFGANIRYFCKFGQVCIKITNSVGDFGTREHPDGHKPRKYMHSYGDFSCRHRDNHIERGQMPPSSCMDVCLCASVFLCPSVLCAVPFLGSGKKWHLAHSWARKCHCQCINDPFGHEGRKYMPKFMAEGKITAEARHICVGPIVGMMQPWRGTHIWGIFLPKCLIFG